MHFEDLHSETNRVSGDKRVHARLFSDREDAYLVVGGVACKSEDGKLLVSAPGSGVEDLEKCISEPDPKGAPGVIIANEDAGVTVSLGDLNGVMGGAGGTNIETPVEILELTPPVPEQQTSVAST